MNGDSDSGTSAEYSNSNRPALEPYKDEERLHELYHQRGWSQYQIADHFNVTQQTVSYWMNQLGIETKEPNKSISRSIREDGKVQYHVPDGDGGRSRFYRHQLVCLLAEDEDGSWHVEDPFDVIGRDGELVVHHGMNCLVALDVPENLEAMTPEEHVRGHAGGAIVYHPEVVLAEMFDDYDGEPDQAAVRVADTLDDWQSKSARIRGWESRFTEAEDEGLAD